MSKLQITLKPQATPELIIYDADGWAEVGVIHRNGRDTTLIRHKHSELYAESFDGKIFILDQRSVLGALGKFKNAKKIDGGRTVSAYVDEDSLQAAIRLGNGNISEGIRQALKYAAENL